MEQLGRKYQGKIETACPRCGMVESEWPAGGVSVNATLYCCLGCAEARGCTCPNRRSVLIQPAAPVKKRPAPTGRGQGSAKVKR